MTSQVGEFLKWGNFCTLTLTLALTPTLALTRTRTLTLTLILNANSTQGLLFFFVRVQTLILFPGGRRKLTIGH